MKVISRAEAMRSDLKRYYTGKACKSGHIAERYTKTRVCVQCDKEAGEKWRSENAAARAAYFEKYRQEKHPHRTRRKSDKGRACELRWRKKNREKLRLYKARWEKANPEKHKASRAACTARRAAAKKNATPHWADQKLISTYYRLARVMSDICGEAYEVDHVVPLRGRTVCGLHVQDNLQILTARENMSKNNKWNPHRPQSFSHF